MADDDDWDPFADPADSGAEESQQDSFSNGAAFGLGFTEDEEDLEEVEAAYAAQLLESLPLGHHVGPADEEITSTISVEDFAMEGMASAPTPLEAGGPGGAGLGAAPAEEGPVYNSGEVTPEFCRALMRWQRGERLLARRHAYGLVQDSIELLRGAATVEDVEVPAGGSLTVCGDVHGQYYDLLHIWELNGEPSAENPYLFNGDFVDRGSFSLEVILALLAWKLCFPRHVHLSRGNHETRTMNRVYGFEGEVRQKYDAGLYALFCEAFCFLPLCFVLNATVFVVHGGLFSEDGVTLEELRALDRTREPDEGRMVEMLWSDPQPVRGRAPSKRGAGLAFGEDVTEDFLSTNGLGLVVRSHELCEEGYSVEHGGRLITVFSAPNYCDQMGNRGAFLRFDGATMTPTPQTFSAVPHPPVPAMHYACAVPFFGVSC